LQVIAAMSPDTAASLVDGIFHGLAGLPKHMKPGISVPASGTSFYFDIRL